MTGLGRFTMFPREERGEEMGWDPISGRDVFFPPDRMFNLLNF